MQEPTKEFFAEGHAVVFNEIQLEPIAEYGHTFAV